MSNPVGNPKLRGPKWWDRINRELEESCEDLDAAFLAEAARRRGYLSQGDFEMFEPPAQGSPFRLFHLGRQ